jgi:DNA repair protein RecO (recombination protein O)
MIYKTRGIVLRNTKYSENSVISHIYTSDFGRISFMVNGVRSGKGAIKPSHLSPLNLLDMDISRFQNKSLHRIKELKPNPLLPEMKQDPVKIAIGSLITEVVEKTVKEEEENQPLFNFLENFITLLEQSETKDLTLFPPYFLIKLTYFLGSSPQTRIPDEYPCLDLDSGHFVHEKHQHSHHIASMEETKAIINLLTATFAEFSDLSWPRSFRIQILDKIISYYEWCIMENKKVNSYPILKTLFH